MGLLPMFSEITHTWGHLHWHTLALPICILLDMSAHAFCPQRAVCQATRLSLESWAITTRFLWHVGICKGFYVSTKLFAVDFCFRNSS